MMLWNSCRLKKKEHSEQERECMKRVDEDNRRKEARVSVKDSLYVVINTQPQTMGQVVEISSTGLAFTFVDIGYAAAISLVILFATVIFATWFVKRMRLAD